MQHSFSTTNARRKSDRICRRVVSARVPRLRGETPRPQKLAYPAGGGHSPPYPCASRFARSLPIFFFVVVLAQTSAALACGGDCDRDSRVLVDEVILSVNIALGVAEQDQCFASDANFDDAVTVDEILGGLTNALHGCPPRQSTAFAIASDIETGSFATVDLEGPTVALQAAPSRQVNGDAVARSFEGRVYVVNRFGLDGDSVRALDASEDFRTVWDCSTGAGTNPHDIAFAAPNKAYVTLYEKSELLIVDPSVDASCQGFVLGSIDLAAFADEDGIPEMDQLLIHGGDLYVSLQRLDRNDLFASATNGMLAVIDIATDTVRHHIPLQGGNPFTSLVANGDRLWVSTVGQFRALDGGIEEIDLVAGESRGFVVSEADLGGDIADFEILSDRKGFAVLSGADFNNSLVAFSPSERTIVTTLIDGSTFLSQVRVSERGHLFIADRTTAAPGLRVFDVRTSRELPMSPLDLGLPPFDLIFLRERIE